MLCLAQNALREGNGVSQISNAAFCYFWMLSKSFICVCQCLSHLAQMLRKWSIIEILQ